MTTSTTNTNSQQLLNTAGFPPAPPEAGQQAGASNRPGKRDLPSLISLVHLPVPVRCAIEWFLNDGPRTRQRLLDLIEHFMRSSGLSACEERELYIDSAIAHVKRVAHLGTEEGF